MQLLKWLRICLQCGRPRFHPCVGTIPWEEERQPTPVFLPGESHGQRSPGGLYSPWGLKESDTTERLTLSPFTWKKHLTALRQTGIWDTSLQCLHPDKGLSQQQNIKKPQGAEDNRGHTRQILGKRPREVPLPLLKSQKQKQYVGGCPEAQW